MGPKLKQNFARRKDGPASSQTEGLIAASHEVGGNATLAAEADEASNQSHGPATSAGVHIKQEPNVKKADIPLAATANTKRRSDTNSTISATTKVVDASEPDQSTKMFKANAEVVKRGPHGAKRKAESSSNEGPPPKNKPGVYRKLRKPAVEAAKYASHANSLVMSGKNATHPQDIDLDLPTICQAPTDVREHLNALEKAGLKLAHADPESIKIRVKILSGLCHAFRGLKPWLVERDGEPRVDDFKWKIKGLIHPLHSHEMLVCAIMIVIERDENQGSGLLLDFMGVEKTLHTLACVVSNRAASSRKGKHVMAGSATTLVVVPKSTVMQWVEEVKRHTQPKMSVTLWSKQTEITRDVSLAADILVVTYDQVRLMWKACKTRKATSLLFDVCYHRIVLDTAHRIQNRHSETFEACMSLKGKHKWALTGTPIPNGMHELWPLLRFIQHPSVKEFADFKQKYLINKGGLKLREAVEFEGLSNILVPISIMKAPGATSVKDFVPLGAEEKVIQANLKHYIMDYIQEKCGGRSNYARLMKRFLTYRKFSASPLLLEGPVKHGLWTLDQVRLMKEVARIAGAEQTPIIDLFERWISEPDPDRLDPTGIRRMDSILAKADYMICPLCSKRQKDPLLADCGHIWCANCVMSWKDARKILYMEVTCPKCEQLIGEVRPHNPGETSDHEKEAMRRQQGVDQNGFQPADAEGSTLFQFLDEHPEVPIPLSEKMERILKLILKWQTEAPEDKIIIFSRFVGISRILGPLLQDRGIGYLYFLSRMNVDQIQAAMVAFEEDPAVKVLMVSGIIGSEALGPTTANRRIIYDPWWHDAVEQKASRIGNRIGQQKETHCVRLFAKGTIDDRMNDLQEENEGRQRAMAELEGGKRLTAKILRRILDGQIEREVGSDGSDAGSGSEYSGQDGEDDYFGSESEDWNDED